MLHLPAVVQRVRRASLSSQISLTYLGCTALPSAACRTRVPHRPQSITRKARSASPLNSLPMRCYQSHSVLGRARPCRSAHHPKCRSMGTATGTGRAHHPSRPPPSTRLAPIPHRPLHRTRTTSTSPRLPIPTSRISPFQSLRHWASQVRCLSESRSRSRVRARWRCRVMATSQRLTGRLYIPVLLPPRPFITAGYRRSPIA